MKSSKAVLPFPVSAARSRADELAFLPAALEIVETPASPAGRGVAGLIIAIFCISVTWACLGEIDIVASAPGKIVAAGGTKVIQPLEAGIVRAIHVIDGQRVNAGDILVELDTSINVSDRNHIQSDLIAAKLEIARLNASLSGALNPTEVYYPPADATSLQIKMQRDYLMRQTAEYRAKINAFDHQLDQKARERETLQATVGKLELLVPILQQRVDIRKKSSDQEFTSKFQYLEMLQLLVEQQQDLIVQKSRLNETEAGIAALSESRIQSIAEFYRTLHGQLAEAERKAEGLSYDLAKGEQKIRAQYLKAPIDGMIQQLAIHTVGGVVTPAQQILVVVPINSALEIEAMVSNRDVGFVHKGQLAKIKIDTFNFTKYGLIDGKILNLSADAVVREKPVDKTSEKSPGAEATSSEPRGQELNFAARVSLDRSEMTIDNNIIVLSPGLAVTVEIKTGSRSVMSYLLSPLAKHHNESLKGR